MKEKKKQVDVDFVTNFTQRLAMLATQAGSGNALADRLGRSRAGLRKWLAGDSFPNASDIKTICEKMDCRPQWLIFGSQPQRLADAKFIVEGLAGGREFYSKEFVFDVALAMNREIKHRNGVITADQHAKVLVSLLYLFKAQPQIETKAIEMILDAHM